LTETDRPPATAPLCARVVDALEEGRCRSDISTGGSAASAVVGDARPAHGPVRAGPSVRAGPAGERGPVSRREFS